MNNISRDFQRRIVHTLIPPYQFRKVAFAKKSLTLQSIHLGCINLKLLLYNKTYTNTLPYYNILNTKIWLKHGKLLRC